MFLNTEVSKNGIYAVNFYALGLPVTVVVDDYIPFTKGTKTPIFAGTGSKAVEGEVGSLWMLIFEKAFAKYHGNYEHIEGGNASKAVRMMNNSPMELINHD